MFHFTSRVVMALSAFLYPGYMSYKTLSQRPASEQELERWLMYWSVLGCIMSVEYVAEWAISWIPLYYPVKMLFLLYLALPQTEGSSYLYINHLQPFFHLHEDEIDSALASLKWRVYTFLQDNVRLLWEHIVGTLSKQQAPQFEPAGAPERNPIPPPSAHDPVSGPAQLASSLWASYGPGVMATGAALLRSAQQAAASRAAQAGAAAQSAADRSKTSQDQTTAAPAAAAQSVEERRRQLQAELDALASEAPMPAANPSISVSPSQASLLQRPRTSSSTGKFEEIEVPSDGEGYDMSGGAISSASSSEGGDKGKATTPGTKNSSWFGWSSGPSTPSGQPAQAGYIRVKNE